MSFEGPECDINKLKRNKVAELSNMDVNICLCVKWKFRDEMKINLHESTYISEFLKSGVRFNYQMFHIIGQLSL
jgi:hypothetical protein